MKYSLVLFIEITICMAGLAQYMLLWGTGFLKGKDYNELIITTNICRMH